MCYSIAIHFARIEYWMEIQKVWPFLLHFFFYIFLGFSKCSIWKKQFLFVLFFYIGIKLFTFIMLPLLLLSFILFIYFARVWVKLSVSVSVPPSWNFESRIQPNDQYLHVSTVYYTIKIIFHKYLHFLTCIVHSGHICITRAQHSHNTTMMLEKRNILNIKGSRLNQ